MSCAGLPLRLFDQVFRISGVRLGRNIRTDVLLSLEEPGLLRVTKGLGYAYSASSAPSPLEGDRETPPFDFLTALLPSIVQRFLNVPGSFLWAGGIDLHPEEIEAFFSEVREEER